MRPGRAKNRRSLAVCRFFCVPTWSVAVSDRLVDMRWYANNALTSVAVLFLGGLAFALAVHHLLREQTAVRLRQIEQARAAAEAVRHSEQQARVQALRARVTAAERAARVACPAIRPRARRSTRPVRTATAGGARARRSFLRRRWPG